VPNTILSVKTVKLVKVAESVCSLVIGANSHQSQLTRSLTTLKLYLSTALVVEMASDFLMIYVQATLT